MKVLSLFDGMSCGRTALEKLGVNVERYYASEVDKHAITVAQANWPDNVQLGNVTNWRNWDIDWSEIDLLIGGSPCQGFSYAGKQLAFDDPRSALFFEYVKILNHIKQVNPDVKFMLENVKMKKDYLKIISDMLGCEPVFINSSLVSAQSRQRYYWANWDFIIPEDKGVKLIDILERDLPSCGLGARIVGRRLSASGKRDDYNKDIPIEQYMEVRFDEKSNCLTTVYKDSMVPLVETKDRLKVRFKSKCLRVGGRGSPLNSKQEWDSPFVKVDKKLKVKNNQTKASCLTGGAHSGGNHSDMDILVIEPNVCRRYSITECERLQTLPDGYTQNKGVSNSQCYKMLGNGWTVDVIAHILEPLAASVSRSKAA
ncbi:DNA cytosine methyltransferase [Shewanella sp. 202IG2-18]|uniref:DNA cytosine methyltransferase n=1 Tax=Parashewanella hymeniacidonis TaxID=2807618 RepID=UPI00195F8862|nr:DNA cytosine methyltransferase [Parashewanella hymeniacidonis]MBM7070922.1 DNA cytosine methyltransferase [Parashewanella hymeniacidonis]